MEEMNWQRLADTNWTNARVKQWTVAAMLSKRSIRLRSIHTETKLKGAWIMFEFIRHYYPAKARELRKGYGYSRFYDLYKEWIRYELAPDICIEHIESDLSNAAMVMQVVDAHDQRSEWERNAVTIYGKVSKLVQVSYDAPEWFRDWASETEKLFKEKGIK
jgi:hypothetical protein